MSAYTREQLEQKISMKVWECDLAAFALAMLDRAEKAEKRMKAWGCPDEDFICYVCGRETPCMTEADLKPGDPGVPCTFDLTYPQMIERLHYHEDKQRIAEAERDRLRAQLDSILANSDSLESGRLADAHADNARLREELESSNRQLENLSSGLSDALEQRDKAREKLRALQEKSDRHESERDSFRLEADRLREELETERVRLATCGVMACCNTPESMAKQRAEITDKYRSWSLDSVCAAVEREMRLRAELREAEEAIRSIAKLVLRVKTGEPREAIWSLLKSFKSVASNTPAVRRARERAK